MDLVLSHSVALTGGKPFPHRLKRSRTQCANIVLAQAGYVGKATRPAKRAQDLKDPAHLWAKASMGTNVKVTTLHDDNGPLDHEVL